MTILVFIGVLMMLGAIAISMSSPFYAEWGMRDRIMLILLFSGSAFVSVGIIGNIIQYLLKVFL